MNRRGITIIEIIVSLALISIVLLFLINLFLHVRNNYIQSRTETDYGTISSTFVQAIGDDIEKYDLKAIEYKEGVANSASVIFTFRAYRPTKLSENIRKVLKVYEMGGKYYISYTYDASVLDDKEITSAERLTNIVRELPSDAVLNIDEFISIERMAETSSVRAVQVHLPLTNGVGNVYDINVSGLLVE